MWISASALTVVLFFGPVSCIFLVSVLQAAFQKFWIKNTSGSLFNAIDQNVFSSGNGKTKVILLNFTDPTSLVNFAHETFAFFTILLACWFFENHPLFPHEQKSHDLDSLWFITGALLVAAFFTVEHCRETSILNRDQTEEWKGWMQAIFLLYHYFHTGEVYNLVRVLISCYVWMTGFGNFSFFYIKRDFGAVRFFQMFWRLNFMVLFLMLIMDNMYILYYICPLHTFYFLVTFGTMAVASKFNHSKYGARAKIAVAALIIFIVWEIPGVFDAVFFWLPNSPNPGAAVGAYGIRYEWHFRSGLDHWSTLFGMVFAVGFPQATFWLKKTESLPKNSEIVVKALVGGVLLAGYLYWQYSIFPKPKLDFNSVHPYTFFFPMLAYIYFRNVSSTLRKYHLGLLASMGKITLETYLLQHHLWLTSNAKTLLVLVPGWPKTNMLLVTCMYLFASRRMYRCTIQLRAFLIPTTSGKEAAKWLGSLGLLLVGCYGFANLLHWLSASFLVCMMIVLSISVMLCTVANMRVPSPGTPKSLVFALLVALSIIFGGACLVHGPEKAWTGNYSGANGNGTKKCSDYLTKGHWSASPANGHAGVGISAKWWQWPADAPRACGIGVLSESKALNALNGVHMTLVGKSTMQRLYFSLRHAMDSKAGHSTGDSLEKREFKSRLEFIPFTSIQDTAKLLNKVKTQNNHFVVLSGESFKGVKSFSELGFSEKISALGHVAWLKTPTLVPGRYLDTNKFEYMKALDRTAKSNGVLESFDLILPFSAITAARDDINIDGVHYGPAPYDVVAQMLLQYSASNLALPMPKSKGGKGSGGGVAQNVALGSLVFWLCGAYAFYV